MESEFRTGTLSGNSLESFPARIAIQRWTGKERLKRGFKRSFKILFPILIGLFPFGFLEPFLFMIWGSIAVGLILFLAGPLLFSKYFSEKSSFEYVEGECPYCHAQEKLQPYLETALEEQFTVICSKCGQTAQVFIQGVQES